MDFVYGAMLGELVLLHAEGSSTPTKIDVCSWRPVDYSCDHTASGIADVRSQLNGSISTFG